MAEFRNSLSKNRIDLKKNIPLPQPAKLCIDPADICNFRCDFCGLHSRRNVKYTGQLMNMEVFDTVLRQCKEFPDRIKQIHLYALGEPLINPNIVRFIEMIKERNVAEETIIVSNGSMLSKPLSEKLIKSGLDELRISVNGLSDEDYYRVTGTKFSFDKMYEEICYYHAIGGKIHVKIIGDYFSEADKEKFVELFENHCTSFNIANVISNLNEQQFDITVSGKNQNNVHLGESENKVCPQMFYELVIHPNGDVGPCSSDYKFFADSLGNVMDTTLKEIWNGERLYNMRIASLRGECIPYGNCNECNFPQAGASVDLTPYQKEILDRMLRISKGK